jgi:putative restriction endonuclease
MAKRNWSRAELILAFNLYCKIPFGRIHLRSPEIIGLANLLGRTPSSVSWKLANFARLDPALRDRNIRGAAHGARGEEDIWDEFNGNWEALAFESERLLAQLRNTSLASVLSPDERPEGLTRDAIVKVRVNQAFFRSAVLAAYDFACCITGLNQPALLNASHIVPWAVDKHNRTNPRNGLCLNAIHDRAFDCGLLSIDVNYMVKVSPRLKQKPTNAAKKLILDYEGTQIRLPERFVPDPSFLEFHRTNVFQPT